MKQYVIALLLVVVPLNVNAQEGLREALRGQVFNDAQQALGKANRAGAAILTPETYRDAAAAYKRGEAAFNNGADIDRVRKHLEESAQGFQTAAQVAVTVNEFVGAAYQARLDALGAEAKSRAPDIWEKAEQQFYEAASRAERGRESRVNRFADRAEGLYREAELAAIETVLFNEIEHEINAAKTLDADDWAPQSYRRAVELLTQARSELAQNRYDTDRPRGLATEALHHARHAQYIARLADDIDDRDLALEDVLLEWESAIRALAVDLDQPIYFDTGPDEALAHLRAAAAVQDDIRAAFAERLANSEGRAQALEQELQEVQGALEGEERAKARLDERIAAQERRAAKFRRVEGLFDKGEAQVLREQNKLIIRLVGLSFTSGSSSLEARHDPILAKLRQALVEFPEVSITVEGHTDSYGVDNTNMRLSVARAESVSSYLLANTPLSPLQISSLGFGEARPIFNNETAEGRARNRRIDVVLYP